tara:strand:+ start:21 stop:374 length:354 start_codon:yes stop_codon:yes gene_type:complete
MNQKPIYVIVHGDAVTETGHPEGSALEDIGAEIQRIRREEDHKEIWGPPEDVPFSINPERPIRVCGAFYTGIPDLPLCVDKQLIALGERGFAAEVYQPATAGYKLTAEVMLEKPENL